MSKTPRLHIELGIDNKPNPAIDLENEMTEMLQQITGKTDAQLPVVTIQPQHDLGRLSADAVLEQYRTAAKAIESMGEEVQKRIEALNAAMTECHADMKLLREAADSVTEKGKHAHAEIERTSAVSRDIREIVEQIRQKLT